MHHYFYPLNSGNDQAKPIQSRLIIILSILYLIYIYIYLTHGNTVIIYTKIQRDQMHHGEESLCCKFSIQKVLPHYKLSSSYFVYIPVLLLLFFIYVFNLVTNACTRSFITWTCTIQDPLYNDFDVFQEKQIMY